MSSHWGAEFGYGMFLNQEEAEAMAKKTFKIKGGIDGEDESDISLWALEEYFDCGCSIVDRQERYDLTGVEYLATDGRKDYVEGVMFYCAKKGAILQDKAKDDCYKNIHEMAEHFRKEYGEYLPADFDYEAHMALFWGANWG